MIKQIQLRGISRSPSDRLTSDGGCAESLNVQLDHGEIVPMPKPEDISENVIAEWYTEKYIRVLYIHKGTYYSNYILAHDSERTGSTIRHYRIIANVNGDFSEIADFEYDSATSDIDPKFELASVTSVGNTLIVSFNGSMWYFLFKDGEYKALGDHIPIPVIRFYAKPDVMDRGAATSIDGVDHVRSSWDSEPTDFISSSYERYNDKGVSLQPTDWGTSGQNYKVKQPLQLSVISKINDEVNRQVSIANDGGKCLFPVFVRYAVRLYDGSLYACSTPILLGGELSKYLGLKLISIKSDRTFDISIGETTASYPIYEIASAVKTPSKYIIVADFSDNSIPNNDWSDIIEGVDLFVSTPILPYVDLDSIKLTNHEQAETTTYGVQWFSAEAELDPLLSQHKLDELVSQHQVTYFAKQWLWSELSGLTSVELTDINYSSDWLSTQEPMRETYNSTHKIDSNSLGTFNDRLVMMGTEMELYSGYPYLPSTKVQEAPQDYTDWYSLEIKWFLNIEGEQKIVTQRRVSGDVNFVYEIVDQTTSPITIATPVAWLAYPDARAFRVDIYATKYGGYQMTDHLYRTFRTKTFSNINVAYVFFGMGESLYDIMGDGEQIDPEDWDAIVEDKSVNLSDELFLSSSFNPFIFPAGGVIDFDNANILGTAMTTKALSQGQFGQFPLYVFTSTGIWALGLNSEGDFVSKHAVSRDVALEGTIAPIDQAIVFTTKKGVMMLTGSDIQNISPDMNGKHYILDDSVANLLNRDSLSDIVLASQNPESFQDFMETAKPIYDYVGERLFFGSATYGRYMYVYRLTTGTWHKMTLGTLGGMEHTFVNAINSYPEAIISMVLDGYGKVYNLSTVLDQSGSDGSDGTAMENGLIVTRPFDLDAPDVRKTIKDLRIRGQFNRGDVKYILLGSFDGINWKRLTSLRGGSFKLFRLVIVTSLAAHESISWIDVDYETRFTNKLR